jgi:stage II sporulation protein D
MRWLCTLFLSLGLPIIVPAQSHTIRIGVLGIFHAQHLTLAADPAGELLISAANQRIFLRAGSTCSLLGIRSAGADLLLSCGGKEVRAAQMRASGRNQQAIELVIAVPGKIRRRYFGVLDLKVTNGELVPIITMDLETAVASVVQAESAPGTPLEALKAQAIVSRSYFVAGGGRHSNFDFCDLAHCQVLREPPDVDSPAAAATVATRDLVLIFDEKPVTAMFTRSCGGHTRTLAEIGLPQTSYPYFSVLCDVCYKNPVRWTRSVSRDDAAQLLRGEIGRLAIDRVLGWDAVPSNNFIAHEEDGEVILEGIGQGHGLGLCQRGARSMAQHGSDFREILEHYFPNTQLKALFSVTESMSFDTTLFCRRLAGNLKSQGLRYNLIQLATDGAGFLSEAGFAFLACLRYYIELVA